MRQFKWLYVTLWYLLVGRIGGNEVMRLIPMQISCQNQRSKHLNCKYIYPISCKIAKIQNKGLKS